MTNVKRVEAAKAVEARTRAATFLRGAWAELKKVHWPTRQETVIYTGVVLVSVAFVSIMIWLVDSVLSYALEQLFKAVA